ncbi:long-chain-fatty-acid--CoA ligase 3 [Ixodes scapularis]
MEMSDGLLFSSQTELSQNLQALSEKAKTATEFIQGLKGMSERVHENCSVFESQISSQCDLLAEALECRRRELLAFARRERDAKLKALKAQLSNCTVTLQRTTALLQFCIEALKETDHAAFLQIGSALVNRVANVDVTWHKDMAPTPWASPDFDLTLDQRSVLDAVNQLTFTQLKPPGAPQLIPEDSTAENNCVTVAWQPRVGSFVQGYVLELDDGNAGPFRWKRAYVRQQTFRTVQFVLFDENERNDHQHGALVDEWTFSEKRSAHARAPDAKRRKSERKIEEIRNEPLDKRVEQGGVDGAHNDASSEAGQRCENPLLVGLGEDDHALCRHAVSLHSDRPCLGTRLVKSQTQEIIDGKSIVKYDLGEYKWKTYADVESQVDQIGRGLAGLGIVPEARVIIFAETREEWILTALACFRRRVIVCTIYATLGDEGIVFSVNETEGRVMVTSEELLPRLQRLMRRLRHVKRIIYMPARGESRSIPDMAPAIVMPFADLLASATVAGESPSVVPVATDVVIIMYRSGSTGTPKGVILANGNVVAFVLGIASVLHNFTASLGKSEALAQDVYLGFLPLAHTMEIAAECCFMALGLSIGYSSPFTLTDQGTALMPNTQGDASVLRPTLMIAVPLLLNRVQKAVEQNLASKGAFKRNLFAFALPYKSY